MILARTITGYRFLEGVAAPGPFLSSVGMRGLRGMEFCGLGGRQKKRIDS